MTPEFELESHLDLTRLIEKRRSIRTFQEKTPPPEWIGEMIHCARWAPSPSNRQPVRFFLIESDDKKAALKKGLIEGKDNLLAMVDEKGCSRKLKNWIRTYFRYSEFMFDAPWLFAVGIIGETDGFAIRLEQGGLFDKTASDHADDQIALGMSLNNFILKATAFGLGTCILTAPIVFLKHSGMWPMLPDIRIKSFVAAGFADENPSAPLRKPVTEILGTL